MPPETTVETGRAPDERLGRRQRLISPLLFAEAYDQGRKHVGRHMILFLRAGEGAALRLGVVTGRKIGDAHIRTRARRRLREVFRRHRAQLTGSYDVLLLARHGVPRTTWPEVVKDFLSLAKRAGILSDG